MTQEQLDSRQQRAENGSLIASRTEEGYRVYSIANPAQIYLIKQEGEAWTCTCPDFETHQSDTTWRCKHILAVAPWQKPEETLPVEVEFDDPAKGLTLPESPAPNEVRRMRVRNQGATPEPGNGRVNETPVAAAGGENQPPIPQKPAPPKRARRPANGSTQMLIKRSVSPDGRIDSVSVEFSMPVSDISNGEIKDKALKILQLQKEIVGWKS